MNIKKRLNTLLAALLTAGCTACAKPEPAVQQEESGTQTSAAETAVPEQEKTAEICASLQCVSEWPEGNGAAGQYTLIIRNDSDADLADWSAVIEVPEGTTLQQIWNGELEPASDTEWIITPVSYNRVIEKGSTCEDTGFIAVCPQKGSTKLLRVSANGTDIPITEYREEKTQEAERKEETPVPAANAGPASGSLHVKDGILCSEADEPVQLRGVSTHGLAWYPEYVNRDAFKTLRDDWNVNTIRLAMYTAESGGYCTGGDREKLLDLIDQGVRYTEELDMYVIIDWHILSDGNPADHEAEAAEFFDQMSKKYAAKDHVIYEICNEPQNSPFETVIRPYAEHIVNVIRKNDEDALILVGTNTWSQDIDEVIGNELDDPNVMYTLHFYAATHKDALREKLVRALEAGVPVYISECSICDASGNGAIDYDSAEKWQELIHTYKLSFNAWSLCNKKESSALLQNTCRDTADWTDEELSDAGRWFRDAFLNEAP